MKGHLTVFASDAIARDRTRFTPGALMHALARSRRGGNPSFLSHDLQRPIGWNHATALYMEPGLARLCGFVRFAETRAEGEELREAVRQWYIQQLVEHQEDVERLRSLAEPAIEGAHQFIIAECVALYSPGIARRVCPEAFALQDDDGLVEIEALERLGPGVYRSGELALFAHHYLRRALSPLNSLNAPFLTALENLNPELRPRVALDPDMIGLAATRRPVIEHEHWWGPKFDDDLARIEPGMTRHEATSTERMYRGVSRTEFWWQSRKGEHIFEVEELRDRETFAPEGGVFGCRYAHAIVPEASGVPCHFDGAVRTYSEERMAERLDIKIADVRRDLPYHKLWRADGQIDVPTWKRLLSDYYRDNHLVGEYLGAPRDALMGDMPAAGGPSDPHAKVLASPPSVLHECLPSFSGPRAVISLRAPREIRAEREVVPWRTFGPPGERRPYVEMQTLNLVKQVRRLGAAIDFDDGVAVISPDDHYYNIAPVWHRTPAAVSMTVEAMRRMMNEWVKRDLHAVVSLAVGVPSVHGDLLVSLSGLAEEVQRVLAEWGRRVQPHMPDASAVSDAISALIGRWPATTDEPERLTVAAESGVAEIPRIYLDPSEFTAYVPKGSSDLALEMRIDVDKRPWVAEGLESGRLRPAAAWMDEGDRCTKCGQRYRSCSCSVWIDDRCTVEVHGSPAVIFVTDRHADSSDHSPPPQRR